jgi:hypothetical protein
MDYQLTINKVRDDIHRLIVTEATVKNSIQGNGSKGVLQIVDPPKDIHGVCCDSGYLLGPDLDRVVSYREVSTDTLIVLHREIILKKNYNYKPNKQKHGIL